MSSVTTRPGIPREEDHEQKVLARLPFKDRLRPNWQAFARILGERSQAVEHTLADLHFDCELALAEGVNLEQWGALVGEQRGGLDDRDYRRIIRARRIADDSKGQVESLIRVVDAVVDNDEVLIAESPPHVIQVYYRSRRVLGDEMRARLVELLKRAKGAAVTLDWVAEGDGAGARYDVDEYDSGATYWEVIYDG